MITPHDILPGESYACKYKDLTGQDCIALILTRDLDNKRLEIKDIESDTRMILAFDEVFDIDTVEWIEED